MPFQVVLRSSGFIIGLRCNLEFQHSPGASDTLAFPSPTQRSILPLADFNTVSFGSDSASHANTFSATVGGKAGPFGLFGMNAQSITIVRASIMDEAIPSAISADRTGFSISQ